MSRRVYILNKGAHDYSGAEEFGELIFCTDGIVNKSDVNQMCLQLKEHLQDSAPDDLIMLSSLTSLCSVASALMGWMHGEVHWLIFQDGRYIERTCVIDL